MSAGKNSEGQIYLITRQRSDILAWDFARQQQNTNSDTEYILSVMKEKQIGLGEGGRGRRKLRSSFQKKMEMLVWGLGEKQERSNSNRKENMTQLTRNWRDRCTGALIILGSLLESKEPKIIKAPVQYRCSFKKKSLLRTESRTRFPADAMKTLRHRQSVGLGGGLQGFA